MKILIGTNNENKLQQFRRIFRNSGSDIELVSLKNAGITDDVEENEDNLLANAKKKAEFYGEKSGILTLADDTGLFVDALGGEPGVHAKRWHDGTELDRCHKLLERLKDIPEGKRTCRYSGVLVVYNPDTKEFWNYQNNIEAVISDEFKGDLGFGYDPIFKLENGKHYAELTDEERDAMSHRGLGIKELTGYLKNMSQDNHIIICSHGFGVKKDDRGLFPDVADFLKNTETIMFDYNDIDEEKNQITVKAFSEQAEILRRTLADIGASRSNAVVDIICHSQGAVIAALAKPVNIRKIIFIAPPFSSDIERMMNIFKSRPGTEINLDGISKLSRQDGSTTLIPPEYWIERENTNIIELYKQLAKTTELIIINANQDDILGENTYSDVDNAETINLDGDHGFHGKDRKRLLEIIADKVKL